MKTEHPKTAKPEDTEQRLSGRGIQPTAMRQRLLDYLSAQSSAQSQREIEKGMIRADRATLHRGLKMLESRGLIHRVEDGSGAVRYAVCGDSCEPESHKDEHLHFHCLACGRTFCLHRVVTKLPSLPAGYRVSEQYAVAKGTCPACEQA